MAAARGWHHSPAIRFQRGAKLVRVQRHHHHAYWRLDFDIGTPGNNVVHEFNDPPIFKSTNWHTKTFEIRRPRDPSRNRKWRVENITTGNVYDISPG